MHYELIYLAVIYEYIYVVCTILRPNNWPLISKPWLGKMGISIHSIYILANCGHKDTKRYEMKLSVTHSLNKMSNSQYGWKQWFSFQPIHYTWNVYKETHTHSRSHIFCSIIGTQKAITKRIYRVLYCLCYILHELRLCVFRFLVFISFRFKSFEPLKFFFLFLLLFRHGNIFLHDLNALSHTYTFIDCVRYTQEEKKEKKKKNKNNKQKNWNGKRRRRRENNNNEINWTTESYIDIERKRR